MQLVYNQKLVGQYGEMYKYGEGLYGACVTSKRVAKKVAKIEGAVLRQNGDWETVYSLPESQEASIRVLLKVPTSAQVKKD